MILVIRGTNGSGKSWTVRQVLARGEQIGLLEYHSQLITLPKVDRPILVIGPYDEHRSMGGCDCIRRPSEIYTLIDHAIAWSWDVLLEGVVLATKPYLDYYRRGHDVRYCFLDVPVKRCLKNIAARQLRRGHVSPISEDAMHSKYERAWQMWRQARELTMPTTRALNGSSALVWVLQQLRSV
jgi:predicted ABC-type ATPase